MVEILFAKRESCWPFSHSKGKGSLASLPIALHPHVCSWWFIELVVSRCWKYEIQIESRED